MGTAGVSDSVRLPALNKTGHIAHCVRCMDGLPASLVEMDASRYVSMFILSPYLPFVRICLICIPTDLVATDWGFSRMAIAFYCLGTLDVTGVAERQISPTDRKSWKEWIWDQYVGRELSLSLSLKTLRVLSFLCSFCSLGASMRHNRRRVSPWPICEREWW